jgi:molybdopterin converting factor small subunit
METSADPSNTPRRIGPVALLPFGDVAVTLFSVVESGGLVPSVTVGLPPAFLGAHQEPTTVCDAGTVGAALRQLADQRPQYASRIFYGERLLVVVTLNGKHLKPTGVLDTELAEGDRIDLLLPVAGG